MNDIYTNVTLQNTVTAITADHNLQGIRNYSESEMFHKYRVPFFILGPVEIIGIPKTISGFGTHVDISPTLIELTLPKTTYLSFGKNLLVSTNELSVVNQNGIIFSSEHVLRYNYSNHQTMEFYQWKSLKRWSLNRIKDVNLEKKLSDYMTAYFSTASYYLEEEWNKNSSSLTIKKEKN